MSIQQHFNWKGLCKHAQNLCQKCESCQKEKTRAIDVSSNRQMEHTPRECFRCGSEDHMIKKYPNQQKIMRSVESKYVLMKKLIVHATTAKIIVTARYMHLWHECLAMTNGKIMLGLKTDTEHLCNRGDRIQG